MKMDRNTVIGYVLIAILLFLYLFLSTRDSQKAALQKQHYDDSVAAVRKKSDSLAALKDTATRNLPVVIDTSNKNTYQTGAESLTEVENDVIKISFSNKGGQPRKVILKNYKSKDSTPVVLNGTSYDKAGYQINTGSGALDISNLYFGPATVVKNPDGTQTVSYQLTVPSGVITHRFLVRKDDYMIDWTMHAEGADKLFTQGAFNFVWQQQPMQHEDDVQYERQQSNVCFYEDNGFDYIMSKSDKKFEKPVKWVSSVQQFFNTTLAVKNPFSSGDVKFTRTLGDTSAVISTVSAALQSRLPLSPAVDFPMQLYYGPNDYGIMKAHQADIPEMDKVVNLGRDFYSFVRPINKYLILPLFDLFSGFVAKMGLVIALLTLAIRLLTSPLVYTSYLSGAKMKALRPEVNKLKEKYGDNQQQIQMEQMKLFRESGVNMFGGCIPALLQIPIFFALYSFFNSNIDLRGQSFLWAHNLASYDVILRFGFDIPLLGNHLSLFTITAVLTSFLISIYNTSMTPDQGNPMLKYMPYIFPFILLFVFNRLPAALTWYYTVSNLITLGLQFVIQNYIIDHDKILAKIDANRKKPKTKSKWQEKLEQMQEAQRKAQAAQNKAKSK